MLDLVSRGAIRMDLLVQSICQWNLSSKTPVRWVQNVAEHHLVDATFFVLLSSQRSPIVQVNGPLTTLSKTMESTSNSYSVADRNTGSNGVRQEELTTS